MNMAGDSEDHYDVPLASLLAASQALYNIYRWMTYADCEQDIKDVRMFTIVLGRHRANVVAHRVDEISQSLTYHYQVLDRVPCDLSTGRQRIPNIVNEYILRWLYPRLVKVVATVIDEISAQDTAVRFYVNASLSTNKVPVNLSPNMFI